MPARELDRRLRVPDRVGDSRQRLRAVHEQLELAGKLVEGRALDVGPLANSRALEAMTAVILNVNKQYKAHAGLRLTGLD